MKLLHNAYTTNLSPEQAVLTALSDRTVEVNLAISNYALSLLKDELDCDAVYDCYDNYFQNTADEITKILGQPIYKADMSDIDESAAALCNTDVEVLIDLIVWEKDGTKLYLRYVMADDDSPIIITLGSEGCKHAGKNYPTSDEDEFLVSTLPN